MSGPRIVSGAGGGAGGGLPPRKPDLPQDAPDDDEVEENLFDAVMHMNGNALNDRMEWEG